MLDLFEIDPISDLLRQHNNHVAVPCAPLLDFLGIDPLSEIRMGCEKVRKEGMKPCLKFFAIRDVVGSGYRKESDVAGRGCDLGNEPVDIGEEGVGLPLVIRGKEVAEVEDGIKFFLTIRRLIFDAVVTI